MIKTNQNKTGTLSQSISDISTVLEQSPHNYYYMSGEQPTFALSLIFWPKTKDIATSVSFFSLLFPSLLPLTPSSSFSCFWNRKKNQNDTHLFLYNASSTALCFSRMKAFPKLFSFPIKFFNWNNFSWITLIIVYEKSGMKITTNH